MTRPGKNEIADRYSATQISTAPKSRALYMLHEKCVQFCLMAVETAGRTEKDALLDKAQNILSQLQASLMVTDAVSEGLFFLYDYSYLLLEQRGAEDIVSAIDVLKILRDTFNQLLRAR
jgi:flagellin-specific chaperone FliS